MVAGRRYRVKVLEKALAILDLLSESRRALTLTEIRQRLDMSDATTFRIVKVLEHGDYLEHAHGSPGYSLGFKLHRLGSLVEGDTAIQHLAHPHLDELSRRCGETVHLVVLKNGEALYLDKIEPAKHSVRVVSRVGMRLPAHCSGVGKVLLAYLAADEVDRILAERGLVRFTANTITDRQALDRELRRTRARGYGVDDEEIEVGLKCVAAPILDAAGRPVAAISISGPIFRFDGGNLEKLASMVQRTSDRISAALHDGAPTASSKASMKGTRNAGH